MTKSKKTVMLLLMTVILSLLSINCYSNVPTKVLTNDFKIFNKDTVRLLDFARSVEDNFITIRNLSKSNLYLLEQTYRADSVSVVGYEGSAAFGIWNFAPTIVPPEDSIVVQVAGGMAPYVVNFECRVILKAYYVIEGEDILREDSVIVDMIKYDTTKRNLEKTSYHKYYYDKNPKDCTYNYTNFVVTSIKNNIVNTTLYVDTVIIDSQKGEELGLQRSLYHNDGYKDDTTGLKMYYKSRIVYRISFNPQENKRDIITTEVRLRDSATNEVFTVRDTLYANVYHTSLQKGPGNFFIRSASRDVKDEFGVWSYVCAGQETVVDNVEFILNQGENIFIFEKMVDFPFNMKEAKAYRNNDGAILALGTFTTQLVEEKKVALIKTTYHSLKSGEIGYTYFPIVVFPNKTAGVKDAEQRNAGLVYPNPASETLRVGVEGDFNYIITDSFGRSVLTGRAQGGSQLDVSNLPVGYYFITVTRGNEDVTRYKFTVIR